MRSRYRLAGILLAASPALAQSPEAVTGIAGTRNDNLKARSVAQAPGTPQLSRKDGRKRDSVIDTGTDQCRAVPDSVDLGLDPTDTESAAVGTGPSPHPYRRRSRGPSQKSKMT
ncbi:hypothetical protein [Methylobacterium sp. GC_Met_2]|uniref:hypothetical protein n=1 Tax=Methylobacterium sp. GC_Met_2 TaxID=2937376 RepID=UPI00226B1795|nr:hypothetical protein [Methylobacterium sp. GC_Met_2]